MSRRLQGKVALAVSAGSIGADISNGAACALLFAREGARVLCVDRLLGNAQDTVARIATEMPDHAAQASAFEADVRSAAQIKAAVQACLDRYGRIDILHHNVGIEEFGELIEVSEESWDRVHAINLKGPMLTARSYETTGDYGPGLATAGVAGFAAAGAVLAARRLGARPAV